MFQSWLRRQVLLLEKQIQSSQVFGSNKPPSGRDMRELRRLIALHRFLSQQLGESSPSETETASNEPVHA